MPRSLLLVLSAGLSLVLAAGCDWLVAENRPETAKLEVAGPADSAAVIVSTEFDAQQVGGNDPQVRVSLLDSDTLRVALPHEQEYDIRLTQRFYVKVNVLTSQMEDLRLQARINGDLKFDKTAAPADSILEFIYVYNNVRPFDPGDDV